VIRQKDGACGTIGGEDKCVQGFGGETRGKEPLGRPKCRWDDDIKMDLKTVTCDGGEWIHMTQGKVKWWTVVNMVIKLWVP